MSLKQDLLNIIYRSNQTVNSQQDAEVAAIVADRIELLQTQVDGLTTDTITVVPTFADLPDPVVAGLNALAVVKTTTGILFINRKRKGLYVSDGTQWLYAAEFSAAQISYDDTATALGVVNVQEAIEAVDAKVEAVTGLSWIELAGQWDVEPTLNKVIAGGEVLNYTYGGVTRYRFVPTVNDPTQDIFYSNFDDITDTLTGPIVARGL